MPHLEELRLRLDRLRDFKKYQTHIRGVHECT